MKKTATKKMTYGGAKSMMKSGDKTKATAKPKMSAGGATKKKYAMAGTTAGTTNDPGDPFYKKNCKMGKCAPGTRGSKIGFGQKLKNALSPGRIKLSRVGK
jgi:hypothetical protein